MRQIWLRVVISLILVLVACSGSSKDPGQPVSAPTPYPTQEPQTSGAMAVTSLVSARHTPVAAVALSTSRLPVTPTPLPATPADLPPATAVVATPSGARAGLQSQPVPILMYHYVRADPGPSDPVGRDLSVTPADFRAEMQYLVDHGYTTMTLKDLADVRAGRLKMPAKPVVLTFDDGYIDFYTTAWPILQTYHFNATIFVISGFVNQPRYMTWEQLRELDKSGHIEVGAHTIHHVNLAAQTAGTAWAEIDGSKATIEQQVGHPIQSFCYPSGRYSNSVVAQVERAGFTMATTTNPGFAKGGDNPLLLPRVRIHGTAGMANLRASLP